MKHWLITSRTFVLGIVLACLSIPALTQSNLGTVTGVVKDGQGSIIPNATLTLTNRDTGVVTRAQSNADGVYLATGLLFGPYRVEAQTQGFKTTSQEVTL